MVKKIRQSRYSVCSSCRRELTGDSICLVSFRVNCASHWLFFSKKKAEQDITCEDIVGALYSLFYAFSSRVRLYNEKVMI